MPYPTDSDLYGVASFCEAHQISRGLLYKLWSERKGQRAVKIGRRRLITREAAADWRASLERGAA